MGVRGLKTYLDGEEECWESFELRDTKVVIDGCGLYYYIYTSNRINFTYGGQYDRVKEKIKEFFEYLHSNHVEPLVVFDGIMTKDDKKRDTHKQRQIDCVGRVERLCKRRELRDNEIVLPRLVQLTVVQVLQKMGVQYAVADFEADCEIASLANELDAPVMANDSDFCIFNINRGYIPFQAEIFSYQSSTVKKFSHNRFISHLGMDSSMLPLLASLIGNDYISDKMLERFDDNQPKLDDNSRIPNIAQFLSKYNSYSEAIDSIIALYPAKERPVLKTALDLSIEEYQMKQSNLIHYFDSGDLSCNMHTYDGRFLPGWVIELYRKGLIASEGLCHWCNREVFLRTHCEDVSLPSAHVCVQDLRYYYALALNCENGGTLADPDTAEDIKTTEFEREGSALVEREVNLTQKVSEMNILIRDIQKMSEEEKRTHLLSILQCNLQFINDLKIKHQLVASALRYWVIHANVNPAHLDAVLVHYVGEKESSPGWRLLQVTMKEVHGFSQWQNVLYWAERLNALFSYTFNKLRVTRLYDGVGVCKVYQKLRDTDIKPEDIVINSNRYHKLYDAITKDLPPDCHFNLSRSSKKQRSKRGGKSEQGKQTVEGNPYEHLPDENN